jgi:geranylgeranylglycerol-phosphate geranylgeranyltransferase
MKPTVATSFEQEARRAGVGLVRLLRPLNLLLLAVGTTVGGLLAGGPAALSGRLGLAALAAALIGGAANSINDVFDVEIDRVNRPDRPLPSGQVSLQVARQVWLVGSALGLLVSLLLSPVHLAMAVAAVGLMYVYSAWLKGVPLLGNAAVSLMVGLVLLFGARAVGDAGPALVGAAFAFLVTMAREILKDVEDLPGDAVRRLETFPASAGVRSAVRLATGLLAAVVLLTPLPFLLMNYSGLYLLIVLAADAFLMRALWMLHDSEQTVQTGHVSTLLKSAMLTGMLALAVAGVTE